MLVSFSEAQEIVLSHCETLGAEEKPLVNLLGSCLAEPFVARIDNPSFSNSAVDGFAVRAEEVDAGVVLPIQQEIGAGSWPAPLERGMAARIFTGAPIPAGADSVVMQEVCKWGDSHVSFASTATRGEHLRPKGEEYVAGDALLPAGTPVRPPVVGLLATNGVSSFRVHRKPRVCVVSTGNEITQVGDSLGPGAIYESNGPAILAALHGLGITNVASETVRDDHPSIRESFVSALLDHDVLVTSGGVSVGEHDLVRSALSELGVQEKVWRVAMKPGKPFYFGVNSPAKTKAQETRHKTLVFGLPGNPVSALVCFQIFCRPALLKLMGYPDEAFAFLRARLASPMAGSGERTEFVRGRLYEQGGEHFVEVIKAPGSHMIGGLAAANALIYLPAGTPSLSKGAEVQVYELRWSPQ